MINYYPFRNLCGDYSASFDFRAKYSLPNGVPVAGPAVTPTGVANSELQLYFCRSGITRNTTRRIFRLHKWSVRISTNSAAAREYCAAHRTQGTQLRLGAMIISW